MEQPEVIEQETILNLRVRASEMSTRQNEAKKTIETGRNSAFKNLVSHKSTKSLAIKPAKHQPDYTSSVPYMPEVTFASGCMSTKNQTSSSANLSSNY